MDSPMFRVLATVFLLILLVDYFVNWAFTVWYVINGDLLVKRKDNDRKKEDEKT